MHPSAQDIVTVRVAADQRGCSGDCQALETDSAARTAPKDLFTNACSHRLAEANGDFRSLSFHVTEESLEHSPSGPALPSAQHSRGASQIWRRSVCHQPHTRTRKSNHHVPLRPKSISQ